MTTASERIAALRAFVAGEALGQLPYEDLSTVEEVDALLTALDALLVRLRAGESFPESHGPLYRLSSQVQNIDFSGLGEKLGEVPEQAWFCANRLADNVEAISERLPGPMLSEDNLPVSPDDLSFACKVLALFAHPRLPKFMRAITGQPAYHAEYLWEVMFRSWARAAADEPEKLLALSDALADSRAQDFLLITYLDYVNALAHGADFYAQQGQLHPFDSEAGEQALSRLLSDHSAEKSSYAVSATAALPFLSSERQARLLALAAAYPHPLVQLEASYARARQGDEAAVQEIAFAAGDPELEARAHAYLQELDRLDALDPEAQTEDAQARRNILRWLAHPNEFGRAPDELEVLPPVTLFWPPAQQNLPMRVFRYRYDEEDGVREGQGVEGHRLFALRRPTALLTAEDMLALHCSWETAMDTGAEEWSVEEGRGQLAEHNPQFRPKKKGLLSRLFRA